jgi:hypothetical protein
MGHGRGELQEALRRSGPRVGRRVRATLPFCAAPVRAMAVVRPVCAAVVAACQGTGAYNRLPLLPVFLAAVRDFRSIASGITACSFSLGGGSVDMSATLARFGAAFAY